MDEAVVGDWPADAVAQSHESIEEKRDGGEEDDCSLMAVRRVHTSLRNEVGIERSHRLPSSAQSVDYLGPTTTLCRQLET